MYQVSGMVGGTRYVLAMMAAGEVMMMMVMLMMIILMMTVRKHSRRACSAGQLALRRIQFIGGVQ